MRPLRLVLLGLLLVAGGLGAGPDLARAQDLGRLISPILTLDRDALFAGTLYGQRVNRELEAARSAMADETRAIEVALEAEERALTEQRATLPADEFRGLADAFDEKVQALRAERAAAETDLAVQIEAAQVQFFNQIGPVLGRLVRERGAVLILDPRAILLAATDVDITDAAIKRVDAALGDGGDLGGDLGGDGSDLGGSDPVPETGGGGGAAPVEDNGVGLDTIPAPPGATPDAGAPAEN